MPIVAERVPRKGSESPGNPQRVPLRVPLASPPPHLPWGCSCGDGEDACHAVLSALHTTRIHFSGQRHCNAHFGKRSPRVTFASVWSRSGKPRHKPRTSYFWLTQRTASCKRSSSSQGDSSHGFAGLLRLRSGPGVRLRRCLRFGLGLRRSPAMAMTFGRHGVVCWSRPSAKLEPQTTITRSYRHRDERLPQTQATPSPRASSASRGGRQRANLKLGGNVHAPARLIPYAQHHGRVWPDNKPNTKSNIAWQHGSSGRRPKVRSGIPW